MVAALRHESLLLFTLVVVMHQHSGLPAPSLVIICQAFAPFGTMETHAVQHASFEADWGSLSLYLCKVRLPPPRMQSGLVGWHATMGADRVGCGGNFPSKGLPFCSDSPVVFTSVEKCGSVGG